MPPLDQTARDLACREHLLISDPDGLAFVGAVNSSTNTRPTSSWIIDERHEGIERILCQVDMDAPVTITADFLPL